MDEKQTLSAALAKVTWVGFDLDDTLHEFRRASAAAATDALRLISEQYGADMDALQACYARVLRSKTAAAFSDGRRSEDYRRERFASVLEGLSLVRGDDDPDEVTEMTTRVVARYGATLERSLQRKPGALELLAALRARGKRIVVVTEGPQDGQEWTLRRLGLMTPPPPPAAAAAAAAAAESEPEPEPEPLVDVLATSNAFGVSKVDGLFERVLQHLGVPGNEVLFVGDSYERDVLPARRAGMLAVHYAEDGGGGSGGGGGGGGGGGEETGLSVARLEDVLRLFDGTAST
ncbi:hypothetical protein V2A60_009564 [Cordyceps javanica]